MNTQVRIPLPRMDGTATRHPKVTLRRLCVADPWQDEVIRARPTGHAINVHRGTVTVHVDGQRIVLEPGEVAWLPAGRPFGLEIEEARGRVLEVQRGGGMPSRPLKAALRAIAPHEPLATLRRSLSDAEELPRPTAAQRLVKAFLDQLERDFDASIRVQDHAERLGVTATHLSRVCRSTTGYTAVRLCTRRTIVEARRLLAETGRPVGEVGASLGYASPSYFTRDFQLRCGVTPSGFRAAVRRGDRSVLTSSAEVAEAAG